MEFIIKDYGTPKILAKKLVKSGLSVESLNYVFNEAALDMMRVTRIQIDSRGHRGGGSWAALKPDTVMKKGYSEVFFTADAKPKYTEIGDDALVKSVTVEGAEYQTLKINKTGFHFGTTRPYAKVQQRGGGKGRRVPARPFLVVLPGDVDRWKGMILRHLTVALTTNSGSGEGGVGAPGR